MNAVRRIVQFGALFLFAWMALQVLVATPLLALSQVRGEVDTLSLFVALFIAVIAALIVWLGRNLLLGVITRFETAAAAFSQRQWLIGLIAIGVVLRIVWIAFFPAEPKSDAASYLHLATTLAAGGEYEAAGTRAYWPPGYAFFLMPWLYLPFSAFVAVVISNLMLFSATLWVVYRLARNALGDGVAKLAALLLAIWPTYLANAGLPEKENLLILLLPLALLLYLHGRLWGGGWSYSLLAGGVLGFAALVQPSIQLFFFVLLAYEIVSRAAWRGAATGLLLSIVGMVLVISPWSIRNAMLFGQPVMIATNGGDVLYRANNPLATGGYMRKGEVDLGQYDELSKNREGFRLAKEWIFQHPDEFARLAVWKQMLFLGDDSVGFYNSMRKAGNASETAYLLFKALANLVWYGLWLAVLLFLWQWRQRLEWPPVCTLLALGYAYFYVIHSVFESTSKYHMPAMALLLIVAAAVIIRPAAAERIRN